MYKVYVFNVLVHVVAQNTFPHLLVCGVLPLRDGQSWKLVGMVVYVYLLERVDHLVVIMQIVLGYNADFDQQEKIVSVTF